MTPRAADRRLLDLLDHGRCAVTPRVTVHGWVDAGNAPDVSSAGQRLMRARAYAAAYRVVRPVAFLAAGGGRGPDVAAELRRSRRLLRLRPGATVLDVCCGPGDFTAGFDEAVGSEGLVVGLDASPAMLARAVHEHRGGSTAYLRGDAARVPLPDDSVDAVACFAALYLVDDPAAVLAECVRVLRPGGALAVMTSHTPGSAGGASLLAPVLAAGAALNQRFSGVRAFGHDEVTSMLREAGATGIHRRVEGLLQVVTARSR